MQKSLSQTYVLTNPISSTTEFASVSYVHDDFLPGRVVGDVANLFLFIPHWLCGVHNVLEHGSLSVRVQRDKISEENKGRKKHIDQPLLNFSAPLALAATSQHASIECSISKHLLEIKGQIGGNDAHIKEVLHMLKLALLEVAKYIQALQEKVKCGHRVYYNSDIS